MSNEKNILTALAKFKPAPDQNGAIADEVGATAVEMNRLAKEKKVVNVGSRKTGRRGRPPVEWALPGATRVSVLNPDEPADSVHRGEVVIKVKGAPKGAPKLVDASHVKAHIQGEEASILRYIERVFSGAEDRFAHEMGDFRLLADRYAEVVKQIERRGQSRPLSTTIAL